MAALSSINSATSNTDYLEQNQNSATNTKQINSANSNQSIGSTKEISIDDSNSNKTNYPTNSQTQSTVNDSLTKESQFTVSFQKSQLLSKLPNNLTSPSNNSLTVKETSTASPSKDLGDYGHLSNGQKKLVDDLTNRQNVANNTQVSPAQFYNSLEPSQKSTFESVTNALENTTIIGKDGTKTNALDSVEKVDVILGEKKGSDDGKEQFRLLVTLKEGAKDNIETAKNFHSVPGHGEEYKKSRQLDGGEPSIQFCFSKDGKKADIDVDYESKNVVVNLFNGFKHLQPSNSDVRHDNHFEKHNKRFASEPGQQPLVKRY